jgi:hypothetical protein
MSNVVLTLRSVTKTGKAIYELEGVQGSVAVRKSFFAAEPPKALELAVPREVFAPAREQKERKAQASVEERAAKAQERAERAAARAAKLAEAAARAKAQPAPAPTPAPAPQPAASTAPVAAPQQPQAAARKGRRGK